MRYWKPFTDVCVQGLLAQGCDRFLHLPLYPQESEATTESSSRELRRVLAELAPKAPLDEVRSYHAHPGYVAAVRATVDEGLAALRAAGATAPQVLFSAHGLPQRFEKKGDPYVGQIKATREAVRAGSTSRPRCRSRAASALSRG
jgi:ferrochelatase